MFFCSNMCWREGTPRETASVSRETIVGWRENTTFLSETSSPLRETSSFLRERVINKRTLNVNPDFCGLTARPAES